MRVMIYSAVGAFLYLAAGMIDGKCRSCCPMRWRVPIVGVAAVRGEVMQLERIAGIPFRHAFRCIDFVSVCSRP